MSVFPVSLLLSGQYFASTMVIVGMSVVATVIVLQFHHHNPNNGQMPRLVRVGPVSNCEQIFHIFRLFQCMNLTPDSAQIAEGC